MTNIELLAHAVLGHLSPLTGTRATGTVTVTNDGSAGNVELPPNTYLVPVVDGAIDHRRLFKTGFGPNTDQFGRNGGWAIDDGQTAQVGVVSNLGGAPHNLPAGTVLRFAEPVDGLADTVTVDATMTDGENGLVRTAHYYEDLDAARLEEDLAGGRIQTPALVLVWTRSDPAEGRSAGTDQGSTRLSGGERLFREAYTLFAVASSLAGDRERGGLGLTILEGATALLTDITKTRDHIVISSLGTLDITERVRFSRSERAYVYAMRFRLATVYQRCDERVWNQWLKSALSMRLPGRQAPEPTESIEVAEPVVAMPQP